MLCEETVLYFFHWTKHEHHKLEILVEGRLHQDKVVCIGCSSSNSFITTIQYLTRSTHCLVHVRSCGNMIDVMDCYLTLTQ